MGRRPGQTLCQRGHTDGQQAHEKIFSITSYSRNANQTTRGYHLTLVRMAIIKNFTNNRSWRGCGEKGTFLHCWGECKLVQPLQRTVWRFPKKLKIEIPYDPAILLLGISLEKKKMIWKDTCTPMFTAALFTIDKTWKHPKCPSTEEWIKKMWYIYI